MISFGCKKTERAAASHRALAAPRRAKRQRQRNRGKLCRHAIRGDRQRPARAFERAAERGRRCKALQHESFQPQKDLYQICGHGRRSLFHRNEDAPRRRSFAKRKARGRGGKRAWVCRSELLQHGIPPHYGRPPGALPRIILPRHAYTIIII